jgi:hypothetical protein
MFFLFLLLLDVPIAPCNATIVPPTSCTSLLPFDAVVALLCVKPNQLIAPPKPIKLIAPSLPN